MERGGKVRGMAAQAASSGSGWELDKLELEWLEADGKGEFKRNTTALDWPLDEDGAEELLEWLDGCGDYPVTEASLWRSRRGAGADGELVEGRLLLARAGEWERSEGRPDTLSRLAAGNRRDVARRLAALSQTRARAEDAEESWED